MNDNNNSKKKNKKEKKKQVISIAEKPFEDVATVQRAIDLISKFKDTKDPAILRIKEDFYKAREQSIFDGIANAHFGLIREGDNEPGRFMI